MSEAELVTADDNAKVVDGVRLSAVLERPIAPHRKKPQYKLRMDDFELMQTYSSAERALQIGEVMLEEEVDMLIDDLEKEARRIERFIAEKVSDISLPLLRLRCNNIYQLKEKLEINV